MTDEEKRDDIKSLRRGLTLFACINIIIGIGGVFTMYVGQEKEKVRNEIEFRNLNNQITTLQRQIEILQTK